METRHGRWLRSNGCASSLSTSDDLMTQEKLLKLRNKIPLAEVRTQSSPLLKTIVGSKISLFEI